MTFSTAIWTSDSSRMCQVNSEYGSNRNMNCTHRIGQHKPSIKSKSRDAIVNSISKNINPHQLPCDSAKVYHSVVWFPYRFPIKRLPWIKVKLLIVFPIVAWEFIEILRSRDVLVTTMINYYSIIHFNCLPSINTGVAVISGLCCLLYSRDVTVIIIDDV